MSEADYIAQHYGRCISPRSNCHVHGPVSCMCRHRAVKHEEPDRSLSCSFWQKAKATTFAELAVWQREAPQ